MTYGTQTKRYAQILVDAQRLGDDAASTMHGLTKRQVINIRNRAATSAEIQEAMRELDPQSLDPTMGGQATIASVMRLLATSLAKLEECSARIDTGDLKAQKELRENAALAANLAQTLQLNDTMAQRLRIAIEETDQDEELEEAEEIEAQPPKLLSE